MSRHCFAVALLAAAAATLSAQTTGTGVIQGTVKDTSDAVVAAARVSVVQSETARRNDSLSNEVGFFSFPSLAPGNYTMTVESAGMQTWKGTLLLQVGQTAVVDPVLRVGGTATEVTVAGDVTPLLTVTSGTTGNVLERARIEQLPLNGRFLQNLVFVTIPGLEGNAQSPRVHGLTRTAMEFLHDGVQLGNRDQENTLIGSRPPGIDTIQEYRVETSNSSAKMSRPAATIIATRSGTNEWHGAVFETHRNNAIGLARRRQEFYDKPPHLVRNEFGASLGGPVRIPGLYNGTNRTFFFFAYEAFRIAQASTVGTSMHTMAMRQGDFSGLIDGTGRLLTLYDPWTTDAAWQRTPFPGNRIPMSRQAPVAKYLLGATPVPTLPDVNPLLENNYFGPFPIRRLEHTETIRIDHRVSDRDQIFGRYTYGKLWRSYILDGTIPATTDLKTGIGYMIAPVQNGVFSWIHTFSPSFFSETVVSGMNEDWQVASSPGEKPDLITELGMPNPTTRKFPGMITQQAGFGMYYKTQEGRHNITRPITFDQNFTKIRGRHEVQFGGRVRRGTVDAVPDEPQLITYYNSLATSLYDPASGSTYAAVPRTGHLSANFFLGVASNFNAPISRSWYRLREREYALYAQDNWKVTPTLTLNLGLRYEAYPAIAEADNLLSGFDLKTKSVVLGRSLDDLYRLGATTPEVIADYQQVGVKFTTAREAGLPEGIVNGSLWNFGPRAGFAWRIGAGSRSSVLRGGYSLFRHSTYTRTFTRHMRSTPPFGYTRTYALNSAEQSPDGLPNYGLRSVPEIVVGVNSRDALSTGPARRMRPGSFGVFFFDPDQTPIRAHEWNLILEHELFNNTVVRAGYVGTHGSKLDQYYTYNDPPNAYVWFTRTGLPLPTGEYASTAMRPYDQTVYGSVHAYGRTGWSNASTVRLEMERRYSRGVGFQLFYVMTNAFRVGGESEYQDFLASPEQFLPGAVPGDPEERNRFLNYRRDTTIAKHRLRWNWIVDLPFGRAKAVGSGAGPVLDRLIGGWQIAGFGSIRSNYWALPTGMWGATGDVEIYGKKYPIQDCRPGQCIPGYLYYNGYIPANRINSTDAQGRPNGVMGVPSNYKPAIQPIFPTPADGGSRNDPNFAYYETNTTWVQLKNGSQQRTNMDTNLHPWRNQFVPGPRTAELDASLFKSVRITERVTARINVDFFNVLNMPGLQQPGSNDGIISLRNSANAPRELQLTLRLLW